MLLQRCDNIIITIENWHDTTTVKEVFVSGWILAYCISLYPFLTNANQLSRGGGIVILIFIWNTRIPILLISIFLSSIFTRNVYNKSYSLVQIVFSFSSVDIPTLPQAKKLRPYRHKFAGVCWLEQYDAKAHGYII